MSYLLSDGENVRVTSVGDGHDGNTVELTARGTEIDVVTMEVVDVGLRQHSVVLELRATKGGAVGRNEQQLSLTSSQSLESALQTKSELSGLNNKLELAIDGFSSLHSLLRGHFTKLTEKYIIECNGIKVGGNIPDSEVTRSKVNSSNV